jgi:hypothetical protein
MRKVMMLQGELDGREDGERRSSTVYHGGQDVLKCIRKDTSRLYDSPPGSIIHAAMMIDQWRRVLELDGS